jgi:predicted metal-dependent RNase
MRRGQREQEAELSRHRIVIRIYYPSVYLLPQRIPETRLRQIIKTVPKYAEILDYERDLDLAEIRIYAIHKELPQVEMGAATPCYGSLDARCKFPYLFVDTDPILYRDYTEIGRTIKTKPLVPLWSRTRAPLIWAGHNYLYMGPGGMPQK